MRKWTGLHLEEEVIMTGKTTRKKNRKAKNDVAELVADGKLDKPRTT